MIRRRGGTVRNTDTTRQETAPPPSPSTSASPLSPAQAAVPERIGQVRLLRLLGRGGMGVVWLGRHELLGRDVAVKFLPGAVPDPSDTGFQAFIGGAKAAAEVRHPGLTEIHDAGVADGTPYLIMEYVEGPTLADLMYPGGREKGGTPLPPSAALAALDAMCEAVAELHDRGIVHRDIKPSNVMVCRDGRVVVTDFGLTCSRPIGAVGSKVAGICGTPAYMAPEMFGAVVSARTDVYAIGITAFELFSAEQPYAGSLRILETAHRTLPLPIGVLDALDVAPEIIGVIERATNKEAIYRPKSARAIRDALHEAAPDPAVLERGRQQLARLAAAGEHRADAAPARTPSSGYYEQLSTMAEKRRTPPRPLSSRGSDTGTRRIPAPRAPRPDGIRVDLPCSVCDYNLRGFGRDEVCPECGQPVDESLDPRRLVFCDPVWLRKVERGLRMISGRGGWWIGYALAVGLFVLPWPLFSTPLATVTDAGLILQAAGVMLFAAIGVVGAALVTSREPPPTREWRADALRRTARGVLLGALTLSVVYIAMWGARQLFTWTTPVQTAVFLAISALWIGGQVAYAQYALRLARRIPAARVAFAARALGFMPLVFVLSVALAAMTNDLASLKRSPEGFNWGPVFFAIDVSTAIAAMASVLAAVVLWVFHAASLRSGVRRAIALATPLDTLFGENRSPPSPATVGTSIPCLVCGRDLAGCIRTGPCPDCNFPVQRSADQRRLAFADVRWLERVERGLSILGAWGVWRWAYAGAAILSVGLALIAFSPLHLWPAAALLGAVHLWGFALASSRRPGIEGRWVDRADFVARVLAVLFIALAMLMLGGFGLTGLTRDGSPPSHLFLWMVATAGAAWQVAWTAHLLGLAHRLAATGASRLCLLMAGTAVVFLAAASAWIGVAPYAATGEWGFVENGAPTDGALLARTAVAALIVWFLLSVPAAASLRRALSREIAAATAATLRGEHARGTPPPPYPEGA